MAILFHRWLDAAFAEAFGYRSTSSRWENIAADNPFTTERDWPRQKHDRCYRLAYADLAAFQRASGSHGHHMAAMTLIDDVGYQLDQGHGGRFQTPIQGPVLIPGQDAVDALVRDFSTAIHMMTMIGIARSQEPGPDEHLSFLSLRPSPEI